MIFIKMVNYIIKGPQGQIPSIQYIEHLKEAGILSPSIADKQILLLKDYNLKTNQRILNKINYIKNMKS